MSVDTTSAILECNYGAYQNRHIAYALSYPSKYSCRCLMPTRALFDIVGLGSALYQTSWMRSLRKKL